MTPELGRTKLFTVAFAAILLTTGGMLGCTKVASVTIVSTPVRSTASGSERFGVTIRQPDPPPRIHLGLKDIDDKAVTAACSTCHATLRSRRTSPGGIRRRSERSPHFLQRCLARPSTKQRRARSSSTRQHSKNSGHWAMSRTAGTMGGRAIVDVSQLRHPGSRSPDLTVPHHVGEIAQGRRSGVQRIPVRDDQVRLLPGLDGARRVRLAQSARDVLPDEA